MEKNEQEIGNKEIMLSSKKRWFWAGIIIAALNPIFAGLIISALFMSEKEFKKEGRIILLVSIIWGIIYLYLSDWLVRNGYLPN